MPVDERDWLPSRVVNGSDDDEMCVHTNGNLILDTTSQSEGRTTRRPAPQWLAPTLPQTPPTVIPKPTWIPQFHTIMIPPRSTSLRIITNEHPIPLTQLLASASRHTAGPSARSTYGLHLLPNPRMLLFRWHPHRTIRIRALLPTSRVLAPLTRS
jgi:hypothetical protein